MQTQAIGNDLNRFLVLKKAAEMRMTASPLNGTKAVPAATTATASSVKSAVNPASAFLDLIKALRGTGDNNSINKVKTASAAYSARAVVTARTTNPAHMATSAGKTAKGLLSAYTIGRLAVEAANREGAEPDVPQNARNIGKLFDAIA